MLAAGHICSGLAWVWRDKEGGAVRFAFTFVFSNKILRISVYLVANRVPGTVLFYMHLITLSTAFEAQRGDCYCYVHFVDEETEAERG